ncbi:MAG TPA: glycosyltransferase family 2 protein, partial [Gallionella sp.]|nr:glycosyltransferase family 2 protein [Gallionella sp.]
MQGKETIANDVIKVVIVTFNNRQQIGGCLDTLVRASDKYRLEVIVVDNGSSDDTLSLVRDCYPQVSMIVSSNLGYAGGCNLGTRAALEEGREYAAFLYLNPDATLRAGSLDQLMSVLLSSPEVGAVSPHIMMRNGRVCDRLKSMFGARLDDKPLAGSDVILSDRLHGCCLLLRPEVFMRAGFMDEDYFLYWEEVDFGLRVMEAGFSLLLCYDVLVEHGGEQPERPHRVYYMWRNQIRFAGRNFPPLRRVVFLLRRGATSLRELAGFAASRRFDLVGAALAGVFAGLRGETGRST